MAEEPQPSSVHEGASSPSAPTGTAEDRKAAAALSSLDARDDDNAAKKEVDSKALGEAMKNLTVSGEKKDEKTKAEAAPKKVVKIDAQDVALLVSSGVVSPLRTKTSRGLCRKEGWMCEMEQYNRANRFIFTFADRAIGSFQAQSN